MRNKDYAKFRGANKVHYGNLVAADTELGLPVVLSYFNELGHLACMAGMGKLDARGRRFPSFLPRVPKFPLPLPF